MRGSFSGIPDSGAVERTETDKPLKENTCFLVRKGLLAHQIPIPRLNKNCTPLTSGPDLTLLGRKP